MVVLDWRLVSLAILSVAAVRSTPPPPGLKLMSLMVPDPE